MASADRQIFCLNTGMLVSAIWRQCQQCTN